VNISCYLISKGEFKPVDIPEELLSELCKNLREKGNEIAHISSGSIEVEGVYIPAKGSKNTLMVLPGI